MCLVLRLLGSDPRRAERRDPIHAQRQSGIVPYFLCRFLRPQSACRRTKQHVKVMPSKRQGVVMIP